jgi:xylan 1,4-beta-xylosidase
MMSALEAINGVPCAANSNITVRLLREQWGFGGFVTSDCGAVADIQNTHRYANSSAAAVAAAVTGGTDWNCGQPSYYQLDMVAALSEGLVSLQELQAAAARFLAVPFALGLVDPPAADPWRDWGYEHVDTPSARALALEGAVQGIVLLKNQPPRNGSSAAPPVLPLRLGSLGSIAIVGPHGNASVAMQANYYGHQPLVESNTPLQRLSVRAAKAGVTVNYAAGVPTADSNETSGIPAAVAAAAASDVVLAFLGLDQVLEREGLDRDYIALPPAQAQLLAALSATQHPLVVVLLQGGSVSEAGTDADALVAAFYPGELGGEAIASVLCGETAPSGRLPVSVYVADWAARRAPTDMLLAPHDGIPGATYWYADPSADLLFPFGAGLSYTNWSLEWAGQANVSIDAGDWASGRSPPPSFSALLRNVGGPGGPTSDASVLGFVSSGLDGEPRVKLFDFARAAAVPPAGSAGADVTLSVPASVAAIVDASGAHVLTPGLYSVTVGGDAASAASVSAGSRPASAVGIAAVPSLHGWLQVTGSPVVLETLPW